MAAGLYSLRNINTAKGSDISDFSIPIFVLVSRKLLLCNRLLLRFMVCNYLKKRLTQAFTFALTLTCHQIDLNSSHRQFRLFFLHYLHAYK